MLFPYWIGINGSLMPIEAMTHFDLTFIGVCSLYNGVLFYFGEFPQLLELVNPTTRSSITSSGSLRIVPIDTTLC
ncbi:hypothetical protein L1987_75950 [Smallanthus sonchifolius]|uniref:Uncharacterized protein n=1 Tax=Smallanthus sonchifolius TaxID=185202 RepID=A0ACB9A6W2_9ASTR|nr:hypothetical protein L1987_75950 [Smallanthus sonchifolius]